MKVSILSRLGIEPRLRGRSRDRAKTRNRAKTRDRAKTEGRSRHVKKDLTLVLGLGFGLDNVNSLNKNVKQYIKTFFSCLDRVQNWVLAY